MKTAIENEIIRIVGKISDKLKISKIILFGSYAYGKPTDNSDIDLCVIVDEDDRRKIDITREIRREIMGDATKSVDIFVYTRAEFENKAKNITGMERIILEKGLVIYG